MAKIRDGESKWQINTTKLKQKSLGGTQRQVEKNCNILTTSMLPEISKRPYLFGMVVTFKKPQSRIKDAGSQKEEE